MKKYAEGVHKMVNNVELCLIFKFILSKKKIICLCICIWRHHTRKGSGLYWKLNWANVGFSNLLFIGYTIVVLSKHIIMAYN